ncbi:hypothetical protein LINPERPRIM_LOCUS13809, partial [Linum perenne]
ESSLFAALLNAKTRGAAGDTQPQPEASGADEPQQRLSADRVQKDDQQADKKRPEKKRAASTGSPPPKHHGRAKRQKSIMRKDSSKKTGGGSKPGTSGKKEEYSSARLPLMQPTLAGGEILERAALQLAADWDISHPRSEEGVRRLAMEQMAIGARLLGTAGALLSADRAHRAELPQGSEELEKQLQEARAAAQQWKAKCSKAEKEMNEEAARLLAEQQKRHKVEDALTAAEAEQKALKEKVALLETSKAEMAKALDDKTKSLESRDLALKEAEGSLSALKADMKKAVEAKAAEELGDRVQGAIDTALTAVRHELYRSQAEVTWANWDQELMFRSASRRLLAEEWKEESVDSQVIPSDRRKELLTEAFSEVNKRHKELKRKARADKAGSSGGK